MFPRFGSGAVTELAGLRSRNPIPSADGATEILTIRARTHPVERKRSPSGVHLDSNPKIVTMLTAERADGRRRRQASDLGAEAPPASLGQPRVLFDPHLRV